MTTEWLNESELTEKEFTSWPAEDQKLYRAKGLWLGVSLWQQLKSVAKHRLGQTALTDCRGALSYAELTERSEYLARGFYQLGLRLGDRAVIHLPNSVEFYLSFFALLRLGVQPVLALPAHRESELDYFCQFTQAKILISANQGDFNLFKAAEYLAGHQARPEFIVSSGSVDNPPCRVLQLSAIAELGQDMPADILPSESELMSQPFAFFQLSGGTTGVPKLIPRTHDDYLYSILAGNEVCRFNAQTRYLCVLPAAHNFPLSSPGVLGALYAGGTAVLSPDPSVSTVFSYISQYQINVTAVVPPIVVLWLQQVEKEGSQALASLQLLQVGGARLSSELARRIEPELNCRLQQVFGMAEGLVNYTRLDDPIEEVIQSQGRPVSAYDQLRIVNEQGTDVAAGEAGALLVKGPYTIRGYFKAAAINQRSFTADGYYMTGDQVSLTEAGNLQVIGREKDQINRGGEKIAAEEIENYLLTHPDIANAALIAVPDNTFGEKSCAVIVPKDPQSHSLKPHLLKKFLREQHLAHFKIPDYIEFIAKLPTTAVGKIDKKSLQAIYSKQFSATNKEPYGHSKTSFVSDY
jgi:2,3-dihydroxybenzoate-AMP ligase